MIWSNTRHLHNEWRTVWSPFVNSVFITERAYCLANIVTESVIDVPCSNFDSVTLVSHGCPWKSKDLQLATD